MIKRWNYQAIVVTGALMCAFLPVDAFADKRVALVVGNSKYEKVAKLPNPANDATDVAEALRQLDFKVIEVEDADFVHFNKALAEFSRIATDADAVMFFYAGHGIQNEGQNYFLPIDADIKDLADVEFTSMPMAKIRQALDKAPNGIRIMVLDACRDNPLARSIIASRGLDIAASRGLARVDQQAGGMIFVYATQPNQVAQDGTERNSPFTSAFVKRLHEPGLEIGTLFRRVTSDVRERTNGKQVPEVSISLGNDYYLNRSETDIIAWGRVRDSNDPEQFRQFIARYPGSFLVPDAQHWIERLEVNTAAVKDELRKGDERKAQAERELREADVKKRLAALDVERVARLEADKRAVDEIARVAAAAQENARRLAEEKLAKADFDRKVAEETARIAQAAQEHVAKLAAEKATKEDELRVAKVEAERRKADELAKAATDKENARLAKIESERLQKAETERQAAVERDRLAKVASDKAARDEAQRLAKLAETERVAAAERDRLAKVAADKVVHDEAVRLAKADAEQLQKLDAERQAALERDRLTKIAADKSAAEAAARVADAEAQQAKQAEAVRLAALAAEKAQKLAREQADRDAAIQLAKDDAAREDAARIQRADAARKDADEAKRIAALEQAQKLADEALVTASNEEVARRAAQEAAQAGALLSVVADAGSAAPVANKQMAGPERADATSEPGGEVRALGKPVASGPGWIAMVWDRVNDGAAASTGALQLAGAGGDALSGFAPGKAGGQQEASLNPVAPLNEPVDFTAPANTPELLTAAQAELKRIGCLSGKLNGQLNDRTLAALESYGKVRGTGTYKQDGAVKVTARFVEMIRLQGGIVCAPPPIIEVALPPAKDPVETPVIKKHPKNVASYPPVKDEPTVTPPNVRVRPTQPTVVHTAPPPKVKLVLPTRVRPQPAAAVENVARTQPVKMAPMTGF